MSHLKNQRSCRERITWCGMAWYEHAILYNIKARKLQPDAFGLSNIQAASGWRCQSPQEAGELISARPPCRTSRPEETPWLPSNVESSGWSQALGSDVQGRLRGLTVDPKVSTLIIRGYSNGSEVSKHFSMPTASFVEVGWLSNRSLGGRARTGRTKPSQLSNLILLILSNMFENLP